MKNDLQAELDKTFNAALKSNETPSCAKPRGVRDIFGEVDVLKKFGYTSHYDEATNSFLFFDKENTLCAILCGKDFVKNLTHIIKRT